MEMTDYLAHLEDEIQTLIGDPTASFWLKDCLAAALKRDPVDVAHDASLLVHLLDRRCHIVLAIALEDRVNSLRTAKC